MQPLMLIRPAQAEALFDARQEQADERIPFPPWLDDDGPEEVPPPTEIGEVGSRYPLPQRRAA